MALYKSFKLNTLQKCRFSTVLSKTFDSNLLNIPSFINRIPQRQLFWERDRKGGYNSKESVSKIELIKDGFKELKGEFKLLGKEIKEFIAADPLLIARPEIFHIKSQNLKKVLQDRIARARELLMQTKEVMHKQ